MLQDKIIKFLTKKGNSISTIKNYIRHLQILNGDKNVEDFNFLKDRNAIESKLDKKGNSTKRSYMISIVACLDNFRTSKMLKDAYDYYHGKMLEINDTINDALNKNEKTEKQKENWMSKEDIDAKRDELIKLVKTYKYPLSKGEYPNVLKMMLISLYTLAPPRRNQDYQLMYIVKSKDGMLKDKQINYLVLEDQEFVFYVYKTAKKELKDGKGLEIKINDDLGDVINLYLRFLPKCAILPAPFLQNENGSALKFNNSITTILKSIFGKSVGVSMLRHFYLTNKYGDVLDEQKKDASDMSHTLKTQKNYIVQ